MAIRETVYIGRDNEIRLLLSSVDSAEASTPINFSATYSMLLEMVGSGIAEQEYTTLTAGSVVDVSEGSGVVVLRLGPIAGLVPGNYKLRLASKTGAGDTAPTQLIHESGPDVVTLRVVDA